MDKITKKGNSSQIFHKSVHNNIALPIPPYYLLSTRESRNVSTNSFIQPSVRHDYSLKALKLSQRAPSLIRVHAAC